MKLGKKKTVRVDVLRFGQDKKIESCSNMRFTVVEPTSARDSCCYCYSVVNCKKGAFASAAGTLIGNH
ncbi:Uncharacterized protein TCM_036991 [Theobroma cacao]|uniref:Uncharacterized protein n=1 Tax=Theobroma cacao TaxID=3641 RepID=A0A061GQP7_THECC|nr:Uncharacterized protein TCM_036991 [Theobroma cacao]